MINKNYKIKKYKDILIFELLEDGPIVNKEIQSVMDVALKDLYKILNEDKNEKYSILIDMSRESSGRYSKKSRSDHMEIMENKQIKKIALVGSKKSMEIIVNFVLKVTGKSDKLKLFKNKQGALDWLKEG